MPNVNEYDLPDGFALLPGWVPVAEADTLFARLRDQMPWERHEGLTYGRPYLMPRLVCWFGDFEYRYSGVRHPPRPFTSDIAALAGRAGKESGTVFTGCLANLYRAGGDSVGWHADDEPEIDPTAPIASVSFGGTRDFRIRHRESRRTWKVPLGHGDLLLMGPHTQQEYEHELPRRAKAQARINLTLRRYRHRGQRQS